MNTSRTRIVAAAAALLVGAVACRDALRPVQLHTIEVSSAAPELMVGDTMRLGATVRDAEGKALAPQAVRWSSSDTTVLTVDAAGLLHGRAPGTATVTAASDGAQNATATATVRQRPEKASSISLAPDGYTVGEGRTMRLYSAAVMESGDTALQVGTWSSSDASKVAVSQQGVVTGTGRGSAVITVAYGGKQASATVHTAAPVGIVNLSPFWDQTLRPGETYTLDVGLGEAGVGVPVNITGRRQLVWTTSDARVVTVSDSGVVTGVAPGVARVAVSVEGISSRDTVTFRVSGRAASVRFEADSLVIRRPDTTFWMRPVARDGNGTQIELPVFSFTVSDTSVAVVHGGSDTDLPAGSTATGPHVTVIGRGPGTAMVVADLDGAKDTLHLRVLPRLTIEVTPATVTLQQGATRDFTAVARDPQGQPVTGLPVTWSSSNQGAVTIEGSGVATARGPGTATITATVYGYQGTAQVTVPGTVSAVGNWAMVAAGARHTCGMTQEGRIYCWGSNAEAQLGTGNGQSSNRPVAVAGGGTYAGVSAGGVSSCALDAAGQAFCWGFFGTATPLRVPAAARFAAFDAGDGSGQMCGLRKDGGMTCWDFGASASFDRPGTFRAVTGGIPCGLAVDGGGVQCSSQRSLTPYAVTGASGALVGLDDGPESVCTWNTAGEAFCTTDYGRGVGGSSFVSSFARVPGPVAFTQVSVGYRQGCGLTADGTAYCWPITSTASGSANMLNHGTPVQVGGSLRFSGVSAGSEHACGVTTGGAAFCWGSNEFGQLGLAITGGTSAEPARVTDP